MSSTDNNLNDELDQPPSASAGDSSSVATTTQSGIADAAISYIDDDDNDLPITPGMAEAISIASEPPKQIMQMGIELMNEEEEEEEEEGPSVAILDSRKNDNRGSSSLEYTDENLGPQTSLLNYIECEEEGGGDYQHANKRNTASQQRNNDSGGLEYINEFGPQTPYIADEDTIAKRDAHQTQAAARTSASSENGEISTVDYDANVPTIEDMIADEMEANIENPNNNMIYWGNIDSDIESQQQRYGIGNEPNIVAANVSNNEAAAVAIVEVGEETIEDPQITEAYPVDDDLIIATIAEPTLPWYKQRRAKILLCVGFLILVAMALAMGVSLGTRSDTITENTVVVKFSNEPSSSISPSVLPSLSPTSYWSKSTLFWEQQGLAIVGNSAGDETGTSTAISADGNTLVVGAPSSLGNDNRPGYVEVYHKQLDGIDGWKWMLVETFVGNAIGDRFGISVSISEDGNSLALGEE